MRPNLFGDCAAVLLSVSSAGKVLAGRSHLEACGHFIAWRTDRDPPLPSGAARINGMAKRMARYGEQRAGDVGFLPRSIP